MIQHNTTQGKRDKTTRLKATRGIISQVSEELEEPFRRRASDR
jgi:hypothetical protein